MRTSSAHGTNHNGFIIPAAIVAMVVISLLALTGLYIAQNDVTANIGLSNSMKAFYAADAGAGQVLVNWDPSAALDLSPGDSIVTGWRTLDGGSVYRASLLRIDAGLSDTSFYRLRTIGRPGAGLSAQRTIVTMVRSTRIKELCCNSAIKVKGQLRIQGSGSRVKITGNDTDPPAWGGKCTGGGSDLPGVLVQDFDSLRIQGSPEITGAPPLSEDPTIDDDDFAIFGELTYSDLVKMADKRFVGDQTLSSIGPETSGGACLIAVKTNWGDPLDSASPCFDYMPIIHFDADLHLSGDALGQGILLIDGGLNITGEVVFNGLIIVQDDADIRGTATITGGLMVRNGMSASDESALAGDTQISYSSCVMSEVLTAASKTTQLPGRYWFEVVD